MPTAGNKSLTAYAHCTGGNSEHALGNAVRQPMTQQAHVYHANGIGRLVRSMSNPPTVVAARSLISVCVRTRKICPCSWPHYYWTLTITSSTTTYYFHFRTKISYGHRLQFSWFTKS